MNDKLIKTADLKWKEIQPDVFEKKCIDNKKGLSISILKIKPNKKIPLHNHIDTRYNFILKGNMSFGRQKYNTGDIVINKKGSKHYLNAGPNGCEFILFW